MDCNYIKESRKLYESWKRGKKPLQTMSQEELIMLDEYIYILYHSSLSRSDLPSVSSRFRFLSTIPKKFIFFLFFILVVYFFAR